MQRRYYLALTLLFIANPVVVAQVPKKPNSVEIYHQIEKLNFLGSALYIAAHPDDENTRLISYLSNDVKARTGYLSLTRGDGGQNLIGTQLRELLGVIRTQELIEARKIDGGEQFFTRANDFGFSKNPSETLEIWDKEKVLADVIWAIRKFQPDVIVNRFDHRSSGTTHGHHTASAMLSMESFKLASDPNSFLEQLQYVKPWQTKRQFFNTSWWFYGTIEKFNAADKTNLIALETGTYYADLGKSNQEIAALSRSRHQSQGFGSTGERGEETEYLEFINGDPLADKKSLFEGIDTSWNRVKGGKNIGTLLSKIITEFNHKDPSLSIPNLVKAYSMIQSLDENHWKPLKLAELKEIIAACAGLFLEAAAQNQEATPGSILQLKLEAINRSATPIQLSSITTLPAGKMVIKNLALKNNTTNAFNLNIDLPENLNYTQPYYLKDSGTIGMYTVSDQQSIGLPDIIRDIKVVFTIKINTIEIPYERTVIYKYNDDVQGEVYNYLDIIPAVTTSISEKVLLFKNLKSKMVTVKIKAGKDNVKGNLQLELPKNWLVTPAAIPFEITKKGAEQMVSFEVTPPSKADEAIAKSVAIMNDKQYNKEQIFINYDHITKQQVLKSAEAKFIKTDLITNSERIAYIMGAGDEVPNSLIQLGYIVTLLNAEEITPEKLKNFDVVMTGVRAYNTINALAFKQDILFDFVKSGKTMIVQYNTSGDLITDKIAPYPLKLSRDRVTEENAQVRFLAPNHAVLNYPNTITSKDFEGWKQEQGLYYPNVYDKAFTPILSSNDTGETPKNGALLIAPYGKGHYVYTGLSFFRELPEGVIGAYKLLSNMISLKAADQNANQ
ncbi:LmbE family N-acetylglucosaminyl deacetylase [Flavobacterium sp. PL11]|uniref:PIG-L family deacetylase n=1 Tax=Flavobacterium sp. PL11 TaxID=3071717 RepID=UPI002DFB458C|nr:LmbE family N-acetylglucosaminyl deacetylase [Flavobacterium sp. PL11]